METTTTHQGKLASAIRWVSFAIVFLTIGLIIELFLISHYEGEWQILPIILTFLVLGVFFLLRWKRTRTTLRLFKFLLGLTVISGVLGVYFHLQANMEFEAELHPAQSFLTNFTESLSGALPALAPGSMLVVALIGYIYTLLIK